LHFTYQGFIIPLKPKLGQVLRESSAGDGCLAPAAESITLVKKVSTRMRMARPAWSLLLTVILAASLLLLAFPSVAFSAVNQITVSLQNLQPAPVYGRVEAGSTSSHFVYLNNTDPRFHVYLLELAVSTGSADSYGVRVYDSGGALLDKATIGGEGSTSLELDLRPERSKADYTGWQFLVLLDNTPNSVGQDFTLSLEGHASTALRGQVRFDDGSPMTDAAVEVRCEESGETMYVATDSEGTYTAERCPLGELRASVGYKGEWQAIWPSLDIGECTDCGLEYTRWDLSTSYPPPEAISVPTAPYGASNAIAGESLTYSTGGAVSNLGHSLEYRFDWGNGTYSEWSSSTSASYAWPSAGSYKVRAQARCAAHVSVLSDWSEARTVSVSSPPEEVSTPDVPLGPSKGEVGLSLTYTTGGAASNLGHDLQYRFDWGDKRESEWSSSTKASHVWSVPGTYEVRAQARCASHTNVVSIWSAATEVVVSPPPETVGIPNTPVGPSSGEAGKGLAYSTGGAVSSLGHDVEYRLDWGDGSRSQWSREVVATHAWSSEGPFKVRAQARSSYDTSVVSDWSAGTVVTIAPPPETISTPTTPSGPSGGQLGQSIAFSTGGAVSNLGHRVQYRFDWGDGTLSDWSSSTEASHTWGGAGSYGVKAQARCGAHPDVVSAWSAEHIVTIGHPPESVSAPDIPTGPSANEVGQSLTYTTGGAVSNRGHNVQYRFDWGDGTQSEWASSAIASKSWADPGAYTVKAQARSAANPDVVSGWSQGKGVVINLPPESVSTPRTPSGPAAGEIGEELTYTSEGAMSNQGNPVQYRFDWGDGTRSEWSASSTATHVWSDQGPHNVRAQARSATRTGVLSGWSGGWMVVLSPPAESVSSPDTPIGLSSTRAGRSMAFTTGGASSSAGRSVQYRFDWGDGTQSGWLSVGGASHTWSSAGMYAVRAMARSSANPDAVSGWSDAKFVYVEAPPETVSMPNAPAGPSSNEVGTGLVFSTSGAISNLGSGLEYRFDWGDRTQSEWSSSPVASHSWDSPGTYTVRAQARSGDRNDVVSVWSAARSVVVLPASAVAAASPQSMIDMSDKVGQGGLVQISVALMHPEVDSRLEVLEGTRATTQEGAPVGSLEIGIAESPPSPPAGRCLAGDAVLIGPEGATFSPPALLTLKYDPTLCSGNESTNSTTPARVARYDAGSGRWVELESIVDIKAGTVLAEIDGGGLFVVLADGPGSSQIAVAWVLTGVIVGIMLLIGLATYLYMNRREQVSLVLARLRDVILRRRQEVEPEL